MTRGFGIVGTGAIAAVHADAIAMLPDARLAAVTDVAAVDAGREPAVTGQSGRDALEIACAVYESSRTGRPVSLGR